MFSKLRERGQGEAGFTLVELLVVMLIIGLLAAIAIPAFFNQKDKANDSQSKVYARTAETAMETFATDNQGSYAGATAGTPTSDLNKIEPTLNGAGSRAHRNEHGQLVHRRRHATRRPTQRVHGHAQQRWNHRPHLHDAGQGRLPDVTATGASTDLAELSSAAIGPSRGGPWGPPLVVPAGTGVERRFGRSMGRDRGCAEGSVGTRHDAGRAPRRAADHRRPRGDRDPVLLQPVRQGRPTRPRRRPPAPPPAPSRSTRPTTTAPTRARRPQALHDIEATIDPAQADRLGLGRERVARGNHSYRVTATSATGNEFWLARDASSVTTLGCTVPGQAGCPSDGRWG